MGLILLPGKKNHHDENLSLSKINRLIDSVFRHLQIGVPVFADELLSTSTQNSLNNLVKTAQWLKQLPPLFRKLHHIIFPGKQRQISMSPVGATCLTLLLLVQNSKDIRGGYFLMPVFFPFGSNRVGVKALNTYAQSFSLHLFLNLALTDVM